MRRWNFISGLTIILLLLLVMAGHSVWTAHPHRRNRPHHRQ